MATKKIPVRTFADFKNAHSRDHVVRQRIQQGIADIAAAGPESFLYDKEFLEHTGLSTTQLSNYRSQFEDFQASVVDVSKRGSSAKIIWCGSKKLADRYKAAP